MYMAQICLLTLIGLPASGKSTFCSWLIEQQFQLFNIIHICYDDFISTVKIEEHLENSFNYKFQRSEILEKLKLLVHSIKLCKPIPTDLRAFVRKSTWLNANRTLIICDDNNYYRSMRYQCYQICRSQQLAFGQIFFTCGLVVALTRNNSRRGTARIDDSIIQNMFARIEVPAPSENVWETNTLLLNAMRPLNEQHNTIKDFLRASFNHVPSAVQVHSPHIQSASVTHAVDMLLRQRIKQLIMNLDCKSATDKQRRAQLLNAKRISMLEELRSHNNKDTELQNTENLIASFDAYANSLS